MPILLIIVGSLIGALYSGLRGWTVNAFFRDAAAVLTFLCAVDVLRRGGERAVRLCYGAVGIAIVLGALQLATSSGNELRASGTFPNPNVAGNLLALGLICWIGRAVPLVGQAAGDRRRHRRRAVGRLVRVDDPARASGSGTSAITHIDQAKDLVRGRRLLAMLPIVLVAAGRLLRVHARSTRPTPAGKPQTGFNSARFDRSGGLRFSMWEEAIERLPETPWGAGPGLGARSRRSTPRAPTSATRRCSTWSSGA